jgi:uncharacterized protein YcaQ
MGRDSVTVETVSLAAARRIALAAQGLARPRPPALPGRRQVNRTIEALGLLQIDSVSVLARAHYMPLFSRLGAYDRSLLETAAWGKRRERGLFEYWAHEASLLPLDLQPLFRWRMARAEAGVGIYGGLARFRRERGDYIDAVLREVTERGPTVAADLEGERGEGGWWGWSERKRALEWLFWAGRITTATRRGFERVYDLTERVIPPAILDVPTPTEGEAHRALLVHSAKALGIATASDLRDYFRLAPEDMKAALPELVEAGELVPVTVAGWPKTAYLHRDAARPRRATASALLSPFDPLVFERSRAERLFGFRYRIEIYTPAEKRQFGYYVLPFLFGDGIAARLDLKADRKTGTLFVVASHREPHCTPEAVEALAAELSLMAGWLKLERVVVQPAGDLAPELSAAVLHNGPAVL